MTESNNILLDIENTINNINQTKIEVVLTDFKNIDNKFKILESMVYSKPINISTFTNTLQPIKTQEKCKFCKRTAEYIDSDQKLVYLCWIHSLEPQNYNE